MTRLTNHVILITGAGGGLGSTAALALAREGAQIVLLDKNITRLENIYDKIIQANAPQPAMYPFDLAGASEADYRELALTLQREYGSLHGLLHSAADLSSFTPTLNITSDEWGHTLNVNLNAPFILTRELLPLLQNCADASSIVFTTDSFARNAPAYAGAYGVTKIAVEGFARILAKELESTHKVRVNILIPGPIDSPLRNKIYPAEDKSKLPPMSSLDTIYTFLFSNDSRGITGQTIDAQTFSHY